VSWHQEANCLGADPDLFFPERGDTAGVAAALAICADCTVTAECLAENLVKKNGIYGGTTGAERRKLRSAGFDAQCIVCGATFTAKQESYKLCSPQCRRVRHLEQQSESHARKKAAGL
jgi:WhiB family redox-sensing transcriptional regulator